MKHEEDSILKVEAVGKDYMLGAVTGETLKEAFRKRKAESELHNKKFTALDSVSFEVKRGETVGLIGSNGAGKSTLLKLISRITAPTRGTIYIDGRVASMLEVGTGFHQELTGRENIYLNGSILGMSKKEIDEKLDSIIEFSECGEFIDTPVKRYSSGMYVKLAFSVAAHLDSEIMIMDEVLAVGDVKFQQKCLNKMKEVAEKEGRTILYVSHNMATV
ncbi:MAG: ABC transporter ATP-binding protein, partial [Lachnospiraceae bacterium]|nr:ABC transporter ATP-binding protein [Lachnospiraceae bacterium]